MLDELTFSDVHLTMCALYDTRAIACARFMVCSRHMSAPTALKETRLRLATHLPAINCVCVCDSDVVSRSLRNAHRVQGTPT